MTDAMGRVGLNPRQAADGGRDIGTLAHENPLLPDVPDPFPSAVLAQMVLDEAPSLPLLQGALATTAEGPLETAAVPRTAGGGGSRYDSDFSAVIAGLEASEITGTASPVPPVFLRLFVDDEGAPLSLTLPRAVSGIPAPGAGRGATIDRTSGTVITSPNSGDNGLGGEDSGSGSEGTDIKGSDSDAVLGRTPAGPGADRALFTVHFDTIDFTLVDAGGYLDGTHYFARNGDDIVILPPNAATAQAAGFTVGTLFLAGEGNDQITGGELDDRIDGGIGDDSLIGGAGDDTLIGASERDTLDGGSGNDLLDGGSNRDLLIGGDGDDTLLGGAKSDILNGWAGNDLLDGGNDPDLLVGGGGNDTLLGGNGSDTLYGGDGDDSLTGGLRRDDFVYSLTTDEGNDTITDFQSGKGGDTLAIADLIDMNGDGRIDTADLDASGSVTGADGGIVITFDSGTSITLAGLDGTGIDSFGALSSQAKVNIDLV
ncbi:calcium-binding protein [Pelagibius sp. 7325]|uniref:calcium-binding protein n=1 Tax=Pelagibius sp. 7325 TaxID=3131994 RepID=UPI0030EC6E8E